jgi:hypothetical protein
MPTSGKQTRLSVSQCGKSKNLSEGSIRIALQSRAISPPTHSRAHTTTPHCHAGCKVPLCSNSRRGPLPLRGDALAVVVAVLDKPPAVAPRVRQVVNARRAVMICSFVCAGYTSCTRSQHVSSAGSDACAAHPDKLGRLYAFENSFLERARSGISRARDPWA